MAIPPLVDVSDLPAGLDPAAVAAACAAVRGFCGWHIAPEVSEDLVLDGSGGPVQFLPTLKLTAVASISDDGTVVAGPEWSEVGMVRRGSCLCWSSKWRSVLASITHGYVVCPEEIVGVVASLARAGLSGLPRNAQAGPFGYTASDAQQAGSAALSPAHRAILARYRIPVV